MIYYRYMSFHELDCHFGDGLSVDATIKGNCVSFELSTQAVVGDYRTSCDSPEVSDITGHNAFINMLDFYMLMSPNNGAIIARLKERPESDS